MATTTANERRTLSPTRARRRIIPTPTTLRENFAGWLFVSPALLLIFIFGMFPIVYALYMSLHRWRVQRGEFFCDGNFTKATFDGTGINIHGSLDYIATNFDSGIRAIRGIGDIAPFLDGCLEHYRVSIIGDWGGAALALLGFAGIILTYWLWTTAFREMSDLKWIGKLFIALTLLAISITTVVYGWNIMTGALPTRSQDFLLGLQLTVFYAIGSVPLQLGLGLILAYVLYQNIWGKEWFRMIFFIPYVTPAVAAAVVFGVIFSGNNNSLANQALTAFGSDTEKWLSEPRAMLNIITNSNVDGFLAGPSMAMVVVIILGVWTYTGYNAVIFLAGLGNIPGDLYEAAKVDGANQWHLFRHITLPLLSPITFYLSILAFIGTFKAFNTLYVMRQSLNSPTAKETLNTAGLIIFDTFRLENRYGEATAQAIVLFLIILAITQLQRNLFEKQVFYG